jgi:hypothetical protein
MNWLKLKLRNWVLSAHDELEQHAYSNSKNSIASVSTRDVGSDPTLQFKVYNAIGGKVVEFSRYDRMKDRHFHDIYIIGKDEDFGEKISRIAMLEVLK